MVAVETNIEEVTGAFLAAKNTNAALKNFLKKEKPSDDSVVRFVKSFRNEVSGGSADKLRSFIEEHLDDHTDEFLMLARYAHPEFVATTAHQIINEYADEFNKTYEKDGATITIKDKKKFESIVSKVSAIVDDELRKAGLPLTNFMRHAVLLYVFEAEIHTHVLECLKS